MIAHLAAHWPLAIIGLLAWSACLVEQRHFLKHKDEDEG